ADQGAGAGGAGAGVEERLGAAAGRGRGVGAPAAGGVDLLEREGPGGGPVAPPRRAAAGAVTRPEEQVPVEHRQVSRVDAGVEAEAGVDVGDALGAGGGPVAHPELTPMPTVRGLEVEFPLEGREVGRVGAGGEGEIAVGEL